MNFLDNIFKKEESNEIVGLTTELKSLYLFNTYKTKNKPVLFVTSNLNEAGKIYSELQNHTDKVWFFPMDDFLTSEAIAVSPEFKISRLETINNILKEQNGIIITNLMGYLRFLPEKENFKNSYINIKETDTVDIEKLISKLYHLGYKRETTTTMTGEMSVRGFILDIFPINSETPFRIEFWGDQVDQIKTFDENTQRTIDKVNEITIYPNTELLIEKDNFGIPHREIYKYTKVSNIQNYLDNPVVVYDDYQNIKINYSLLVEEMQNYSSSINLDKNTKYMHTLESLIPSNVVYLNQFSSPTQKQSIYKTKEIEPFKNTENINKSLNNYLKNKYQIIICLENRYQANRIIDDLENKNTVLTNENEIYNNKINIIIKKLNSGFELDKLVVLTPKELYGKKDSNTYKTKFRYGSKIKDITKLQIGDYVVHGSHGIGRYLGLKTILKNGLKKDYLNIEYKDGDKLYIPVEKLELISKYSGKEGVAPKINKLGTYEWEKTKARARKRAEDIAADLLNLYAIRESQKGFAFQKDDENQLEFEKQFKYEETKDQLRVVEEIKKDMQKSKPMDRLVCGDVGFGKTEVAFRAIFKCILSGKQAALLCPTTILSSQHFQNAIERFKSFPVNIEILNRFVTPKQVKKIIEDLEEGKIDLLIGTHRILSDDIKFKDLGLLVIDEEQRFGVKHKEKIKQYKNNVDVLTLSATPIPRTLQMSMVGIRNLSMLETPPKERYPVQTYVLAQNNQIIKDAVEKELTRGGQAFILFNNVEQMESKLIELKMLIKDAKIEMAHGKMTKTELENVMERFNDHEFDILLCTTIIETGIDIPNVNTLIIIDADHFGLSQLYQIRGRIGRSNKIAYCYLMYNQGKILSEIAVKRLNVIKDFTELGSGFAIAMRDLSIRGAGDILGSEQAGFIDSVGIELFLEMLNEEVNRLQGKNVVEQNSEETKPLLDIETSIEDKYVDDEELKIEIHKKINSIDSYQKLEEIKDEIEDRFGKITNEMEIYMYEELFEKKAILLGITQIRQTKNFIEIVIPEETLKNIDGQYLFYETSSLSKMFRFSSKGKNLAITLDTIKLEKHFIFYLVDLLEIIIKSQKQK